MRRRLRVDARILSPGGADKVHRFRGGDVLNAERRAERHRDPEIAAHHGDLCIPVCTGEPEMGRGSPAGIDAGVRDKCRVLLMQGDGHIQLSGVPERLPEQRGIENRPAVVREAGGARGAERPHIGELPALHIAGDVGTGQKMNRRQSAAPQNILQRFHGTDRRAGVAHQNNGGVAARSGCGSTCLQVFLFCKAGITEMRVRIDKTRHDRKPAGIENGKTVIFFFCRGQITVPEVRRNACNRSVLNQDIAFALCPGGGINKPTISDEQHETPFLPYGAVCALMKEILVYNNGPGRNADTGTARHQFSSQEKTRSARLLRCCKERGRCVRDEGLSVRDRPRSAVRSAA